MRVLGVDQIFARVSDTRYFIRIFISVKTVAIVATKCFVPPDSPLLKMADDESDDLGHYTCSSLDGDSDA